MKPEKRANNYLSITRSKAKMFEFNIPESEHLETDVNFIDLLDLTIGIIGDYTSNYDFTSRNANTSEFLFSAKYFDALINIRNLEIAEESHDYLTLLGAVAYYLSDNIGSSKVLIKYLNTTFNLNASNLENIIFNIINKSYINPKLFEGNNFEENLVEFSLSYNVFLSSGENSRQLLNWTDKLMKIFYRFGSGRELLFADIINALIKKYVVISAWTSLPKYSNLPKEKWEHYLKRPNAIKEFWPSQVLLGEKDIFRGKSAVIQMPTSAGKTKSAELIIRSAFIKGQTNLAVIVAPFRALCHEIHNDFYQQFSEDLDIEITLVSDVMQFDLNIENFEKKYVLILTPEKLDFILKHQIELSKAIGLIIYDEGHLFDDESRGVKYELLLASLKRNLPNRCQTILISAVMPNSYDIGSWLIGENFAQVEAKEMSPTQRNIAFTNWEGKKAILQFANPSNIDSSEFYVPKVFERQKLKLKPRERSERFYPRKGEPSEIAMTLGCKLVQSGPVAIFTARKDSATKCAREIIEAFERGFSVNPPSEFMDEKVMHEFSNYLSKILGHSTIPTKAASYGILMHNGSIPEGVRSCVEYALQNQKAKFVICTSTLSQGVNLPIRYLIITTTHPGRDEIKIRDFHNLMGRAGRAGKYTEGNIIFADNTIYDAKKKNDWYWNKAKNLLNTSMSENCQSKILEYFKSNSSEEELIKDTSNKINTTNSVKDYLISALEDVEDLNQASIFASELAENTLAFYQANDIERNQLKHYFQEITKEIFMKIPNSEMRKSFSKVTLALDESLLLYDILSQKIHLLKTTQSFEEFVDFIWPIIYRFTNLPEVDNEILKNVLIKWISGETYSDIFDFLEESRVRIKSNRNLTIDHVIDLCEDKYGYESSMVVGSCIELIQSIDSNNNLISQVEEMKLFQKKIKYGLKSKKSILVYEIGFNDRYLAQQIAKELKGIIRNKRVLKKIIRLKPDPVKLIVNEYPDYYRYILSNITG